ncbi:hypothetical protein F4604DRAFT_1675467 [Suillus subluteus]|nr:hypothetical protein F4604DRAFT_1675467 [Suillus subluteus]
MLVREDPNLCLTFATDILLCTGVLTDPIKPPIFHIHLLQLATRKKHCKADEKRAQNTRDKTIHWEADTFSAKFRNVHGVLMATYFSNSIVAHNAPLSPKLDKKHASEYLGCSVSDLENTRLEELEGGLAMIFDGIKSEDAVWASQVLHNFLQQPRSPSDGCHNWEDVLMRYTQDQSNIKDIEV